MNKTGVSIFLLLLILVQGCIKELDVVPPYEGDKPVVNGWLCSEDGLVVSLTASRNPVGKFIIDSLRNLNITDANVLFFENQKELFELQHLGNGLYGIPDTIDFEATPGLTYRLVINSPQYGKVETTDVIFPKPIRGVLASLDNIGRAPYENNERGRIRFNLDWLPATPSFVILELHSNEKDFHYIFWEDHQYRNNFSNNCETESPYGMVLSNLCGYRNIDTLSVITYIQYTQSGHGSGSPATKHYYTNMHLTVVSVSQSYFDYIAAMNYYF